MKKKNRNDPSLVDTNVGFKQKQMTMAWLTQSAIKLSGLEPYEHLRMNNSKRADFKGWKRMMLLSFVFWGGGLAYIEKTFVASFVFFFMMVSSALFVSAAWNLHWFTVPIHVVPYLLFVGSLMVAVWGNSIVLPLYFLAYKRGQRKYSLMVFSFLTWSMSSVILWRIHSLLQQQIIHGWEFEEEFIMLGSMWIVSAIVLSGEVLSFFLQPLYAWMQRDHERDNFRDVFFGFWLGCLVTLALIFAVKGPLAGPFERGVEGLSKTLRQNRFEKIPNRLDFFLTQFKNG